MLELNKIYCMDCLEGMKLLPNECIDLTVTSPPYDNLRTYNGNIEQWSFEKFQAIAKELYRVTKQGGVVVWVIGDSVVRGSETGNAFRQALHFKEIGFNLHDTMIYQKNAFPFPDKTRYAQVFEYMFVLSKGKPNTTNIIRVPTKEANRIKNKKSCQRLPNGETVPMKYETGKSERNKENVWMFEVGYMKTTKDKFAFQHPAMFPEQLANDHILSWSNEGDVVLDPFMGSGTTAKMALLNNRNYIGFELDAHYCEIANERIRKALAEKEVSK